MTWPLPFYGFDWQYTFYHAARMLLTGHNPYLVSTFNNPPWTLLPLIPFALLPESIGTTLYFVFNVLAYAFVAHKLQARPLAFVAFMLSTPVLYGLYRLNIDALVLVGFVLPAPIGLFFVLMKPQMGFAMVIYWFVQAWKTGGIKKVALTFGPVVIVFGFSFLFFGNWITNRQPDLTAAIWNTSLWPWSIPIGLVFLAVSLRDMRQDFAMAASPFISPYVAYYSWVGVLAGFLGDDYILVIAVVGMWIAQIILFWH